MEVIGPPATWQFDFGDSFGDSCGGLTDEDIVTSMASKETRHHEETSRRWVRKGTCRVAQAQVPSIQESPVEGLFGLSRKRLWGGLGETAASKKGRREDRAGSRPRSNHQHAMALYPHQLV